MPEATLLKSDERGLPQSDQMKTQARPPLISYGHLAAALLAGLALRLYFILHFPFHAGDTKYYEELARNWMDHGVYGLMMGGKLVPVDMRVPGYPAFLVAVYSVFGRSETVVMIVQAVIDLVTCVLTAMIAARLAPASKRTVAATVALWLAALCPFTANYTAVVLTETLATFITAGAILIFVGILVHPDMKISRGSIQKKTLLSYVGWFFLGGLLVGLGALVRPETPLLLIAMGIILCVLWRRRSDWWKLALAVGWMAVGLLLPLTPWAVRNVVTLQRVQYLAPRYAQAVNDYAPLGFFRWTQTWMVRFGDSYLAPWKISPGNEEPIHVETLPSYAFDSDAERDRVAALLDVYNTQFKITPELDAKFAEIARERTRQHPLRTYLLIPIERSFFMWFTPRVELLPYTGKLWPPLQKWRRNKDEFDTTLGFGVLGIILIGMAMAGAWRRRSRVGIAFLLTLLLVRTAFLTQLQTVEPRYVIECFPVVLALAALAFVRQDKTARRLL
jgi:hypothetical protein